MVEKAALGLAMLLAAETDGTDRRPAVRLRYESTRRAVSRALDAASERLARPACSALLDEFVAVDGRRLRDGLTERGLAAPAYLDRVLFYDGDIEPACRRKDVLAVAMPGNPVVKVCPGFYQRWVREPAYAEATLIHEVFHTLGLGENPPSSREITQRVIDACIKDEAMGATVVDTPDP
jgi:hypothetical protein